MIERIFGVFKRQFSLTKAAPEYPIRAQTMFIPALAAVFNFISIHDPTKMRPLTPTSSERSITEGSTSSNQPTEAEFLAPDDARVIAPEVLGLDITPAEKRRAGEKRDQIATQMWTDYQAELRRRGEL